MAQGTFTSLRLAERLSGAGGSVLLLVPSLSLLSQSLREWCTKAEVPLAPLAVCSDRKATTRSKATNEDLSAVDLALPSTTNVAVLKSRLTQAMGDPESMSVVFCTYQSINVVHQAQRQGELPPFDLIICDEAHRTTGTTLAGQDESAFVRVHDDAYLAAAKRLYMIATPRIYDDSSKSKAGEANAVLASMDDEEIFARRVSAGQRCRPWRLDNPRHHRGRLQVQVEHVLSRVLQQLTRAFKQHPELSLGVRRTHVRNDPLPLTGVLRNLYRGRS